MIHDREMQHVNLIWILFKQINYKRRVLRQFIKI